MSCGLRDSSFPLRRALFEFMVGHVDGFGSTCNADYMFARALDATAQLRPLEVWHAEQFAAHMDQAREHIRPWVGAAFVTDSVAGATATLSRYAASAAADGARLYGNWVDGVLRGGVMFVSFNAAAGVCEIGCWLEPAAEGKGLVTRAADLLAQWALLDRGLNRVEWHCRADNVRSAAVAERLGMTLEGTLRGAWLNGGTFHDEQVWALLRSERMSADLEALEEFEMTQDIAAYRAAEAGDDGARVTVNELRTEIDS